MIKGTVKTANKITEASRGLFLMNMSFLPNRIEISRIAGNPKLVIETHYLGAAYDSQAPHVGCWFVTGKLDVAFL
jgi:hypothetical protein